MRGEVKARVAGLDGDVVDLGPDEPVVAGRDLGCTLTFPDEERLSRRAAVLSWNGFGVVITNVSRTHGLVVDAGGATARLPRVTEAGPTAGYFLARGAATVSGPSWPDSSFAVTVEVVRTVAESSVLADFSGQVVSTATREPLRLDTGTKEFLTALLLCRHRLLDAAAPGPPPAVPQLTRTVLETSNSWHLVRALERDEEARARLTGRVHEHLKSLRAKVVRHGLAPEGARLTPSVLVEVLLGSEAVTRDHLALLDDERWLAHQEQQWWAFGT